VSDATSSGPGVHGHGRRLLLQAARELFAQKGYSGASTREIAGRAGVTEPMLFRHFGTKQKLFQEAAVAPITEFINRYAEDYRNREHGKLSPEEEGRRFYGELFKVLYQERELLLALMSAHQFEQVVHDISQEVRSAFGQVLQMIEEVVASESIVRHFTDMDLQATVRVMFGMALSLALHGEWMTIPGTVSYDRMLDAMTRISVQGLLGNRPDTPTTT
jgi:AcrR family transcriptional regulator